MKGLSYITKIALVFIALAVGIFVFSGINSGPIENPKTPWLILDQTVATLSNREIRVEKSAKYQFEDSGYNVSIERFDRLNKKTNQTPYVIRIRPTATLSATGNWIQGGLDVATTDFAPEQEQGELQIVAMRIAPTLDSKKVD